MNVALMPTKLISLTNAERLQLSWLRIVLLRSVIFQLSRSLINWFRSTHTMKVYDFIDSRE